MCGVLWCAGLHAQPRNGALTPCSLNLGYVYADTKVPTARPGMEQIKRVGQSYLFILDSGTCERSLRVLELGPAYLGGGGRGGCSALGDLRRDFWRTKDLDPHSLGT